MNNQESPKNNYFIKYLDRFSEQFWFVILIVAVLIPVSLTNRISEDIKKDAYGLVGTVVTSYWAFSQKDIKANKGGNRK